MYVSIYVYVYIYTYDLLSRQGPRRCRRSGSGSPTSRPSARRIGTAPGEINIRIFPLPTRISPFLMKKFHLINCKGMSFTSGESGGFDAMEASAPGADGQEEGRIGDDDPCVIMLELLEKCMKVKQHTMTLRK